MGGGDSSESHDTDVQDETDSPPALRRRVADKSRPQSELINQILIDKFKVKTIALCPPRPPPSALSPLPAAVCALLNAIFVLIINNPPTAREVRPSLLCLCLTSSTKWEHHDLGECFVHIFVHKIQRTARNDVTLLRFRGDAVRL